MSTPIINPESQSAHWYTRDGQPMHTVIGSSTGKPRPTNITDARKLGLLPSVTTITKILDRPALNRWRVEQGILAAMTTPRLDGEADDAYFERVFNVEKQHEQEAEKARNLGTDIHAAIEGMLNGRPCDEVLRPYVDAAHNELKMGLIGHLNEDDWRTEFVVVGDGYAGKVDLGILYADDRFLLVDFKTAKNLPKTAYPENAMQLAAYEAALNPPGTGRYRHVRHAMNIFVSTTEPGKAVTIMHENLSEAYQAFRRCLELWRWLNKF
jgi:hypothetical protein